MKKRIFSVFFLLVLNLTGVLYAQSEDAKNEGPSILSPDFGGVNYLSKAPAEFRLILADSETVQTVSVNGQTLKISPAKTVIVPVKPNFVTGKNTITVIATNAKNGSSTKEFVFYYDTDEKKLEQMKSANLPPEERPSMWTVGIGANVRNDSNAAHLSDNLESFSDADKELQIRGLDFNFSWRKKLDKEGKQTFSAGYLYFMEDYQNKKVAQFEQNTRVADFKFDELSLSSHNLILEWQLEQTQQSFNLTYLLSTFDGNANKSEVEDSTTDNGDEAIFHFIIPTYTRVHDESFSSLISIPLSSKNFRKEPKDSNTDRDSALSGALNYNLFYFLPQAWGRVSLLASMARENAEGKFQRYTQNGLGAKYDFNRKLSYWDSEWQFSLGSHGRYVLYDEKNTKGKEASAESAAALGDTERRKTTTQADTVALSWSCKRILTTSLSYSKIRANSTNQDYTFDSDSIAFGINLTKNF